MLSHRIGLIGRRCLACVAAVVSALGVAWPGPALGASPPLIYDLPPTIPGYTVSYGIGVNANGQVAGYSQYELSGLIDPHALFYYGPPNVGTAVNLGPLVGSPSSYGVAINASGLLAGDYVNDAGRGNQAFTYNPATGSIQNFGFFG
jgi:hypothetical protein